MGEFKPQDHESEQQLSSFEGLDSDKNRSEELNKPEEETPEIDVEAARETIQAQQEQDTPPLELPVDGSPDGDQPIYIDRAMKRIGLENEMKLIRTKLSTGQKLLSRTVHQTTVRRVSDAAAHTITRPAGLLGGGVLAFCGSLIYLLFSKYIGFRYNYLLFIFLFILGYALTTAFELLIKAVRSPKSR